MTATVIRSAGVLPDLRRERRDALRREVAAIDELEAGAAELRAYADRVSRAVIRAPRALPVELLPTAQRLRLRGRDRWVPTVPPAAVALRPAPPDPVAAYMAQPDLCEPSLRSRIRERAGDAVLAVAARVVVPRRTTAAPQLEEEQRRRRLLAPLAAPPGRWARLHRWAVDWAEWLKPSHGGPQYGVRRVS